MLNPADLEKYKKKLEEEKIRLTGEIEKESTPSDFGSDVDGGDEEADEAEELSNKLAVAETLRSEVREIDNALERIASESYGICVKCGADIKKEVLDAAPESALCETCKQGS